MRSPAAIWVFLPFCLGAAVTSSRAEQLAFQNYGSAEGVAETQVVAIYQDQKGYLWFGSNDGLTRFDGYRFQNYGLREGLGYPLVSSIAEDREGRLWVGMNGGGVARLSEEPPDGWPVEEPISDRPLVFETHSVGDSDASNHVKDIAFDADGALWCLADDGLYRADPGSLQFEAILPGGPSVFGTLLVDSRGRLWAGANEGLVQIERGEVTRWVSPEPIAEYTVRAIIEDAKGRILVANRFAIFVYSSPAGDAESGSWRKLPLALVPSQEIWSMWADLAGTLWIGTTHGLVKYSDDRQELYTTAHGLRNDFIWALAGDRDGNLWIGTWAGPVKLAARSPVAWTTQDGLPDPSVSLVIPSHDGRIYVRTFRRGLAEVVGVKVVPVPRSEDPRFREVMNMGTTQVLQDSRSDWWVASSHALYRFGGPELQLERGHRFTAADGILDGTLFGGWTSGIHEDASGHIWVASRRGLYVFDPKRTEQPFFDFLPLVGFDEDDGASDIVSDRSGTIWFRTHRETVRVVDGQLERLLPTEGLPTTVCSFLFADSRGRLWVGTGSVGVSMTAEPSAREPKWIHYSTANGLSSDSILTAAEDPLGNIYLGSTNGLDRLEPDTGHIRRFTTRHGLVGSHISHLLTDKDGYLWVATQTGLTRFDPRSVSPDVLPPPVQLTDLQIAGERLWLPERGAHEVPSIRLASSQNNLQIDFVGLSLRTESSLRYQYRLEGVDADWSPPSEQRSVHYARLAPGSYRFEVRALAEAGASDQEPASVAFTIAAPWWSSWWFLIVAVILATLTIEWLNRLRLRRRLELEAIRTRLATNLHDDIGSNLSRIAILSEVAQRDLDGAKPTTSERLSRIAAVSRELVDSMSDIVWAVNPSRDRLDDLTRRMRRFGDDLLGASDIAMQFSVANRDDVPIEADTRREVFLVFKEAVNNLTRHSGARVARIELGIDDGWLALRVSDDGSGFDSDQIARASDGNGLTSMKRRAENLSGTLDVISVPGEGTTVALRVPLQRRGWTDRLRNR
ncbi:MAG TPA: two-component regulator propeller domain-containing protein [Vicinamibacteria bacterium]|nr:two-component regulator propeller domain-containing protein [Vicinamibacteria bacterium]